MYEDVNRYTLQALKVQLSSDNSKHLYNSRTRIRRGFVNPEVCMRKENVFQNFLNIEDKSQNPIVWSNWISQARSCAILYLTKGQTSESQELVGFTKKCSANLKLLAGWTLCNGLHLTQCTDLQRVNLQP